MGQCQRGAGGWFVPLSLGSEVQSTLSEGQKGFERWVLTHRAGLEGSNTSPFTEAEVAKPQRHTKPGAKGSLVLGARSLHGDVTSPWRRRGWVGQKAEKAGSDPRVNSRNTWGVFRAHKAV